MAKKPLVYCGPCLRNSNGHSRSVCFKDRSHIGGSPQGGCKVVHGSSMDQAASGIGFESALGGYMGTVRLYSVLRYGLMHQLAASTLRNHLFRRKDAIMAARGRKSHLQLRGRRTYKAGHEVDQHREPHKRRSDLHSSTTPPVHPGPLILKRIWASILTIWITSWAPTFG
jgi:hypothetical protein